ncbi:MAG TPA: OsmC family peroxiredoxin [Gammaproteobacteria bacterium]|nr:OsmC family peroxiredoxin [Gammaproteobacteria bacterium]
MSNQRAVHVRWMGQYQTNINIRGVHQLNGDETSEYGGNDSGPMPTEFFLASVASCLCLAITHIGQKKKILLNSVEVIASGEKDPKFFQFKNIHLEVQADLPETELQPLVMQAKKYCFVSNTIIKGCPINVTTKSTLLTED